MLAQKIRICHDSAITDERHGVISRLCRRIGASAVLYFNHDLDPDAAEIFFDKFCRFNGEASAGLQFRSKPRAVGQLTDAVAVAILDADFVK